MNNPILSPRHSKRNSISLFKPISYLAIYSSLFFLLFFISASPAFAGIEVSSLAFSLKIPVNGSETSTFRVTNSGNEPEDVRITYTDWYRERGGKYYYVEGGTVERSIFDWIQITPMNFSLQPGEYRDVTFTIAVPERLQIPRKAVASSGDTRIARPEGTYWGMLFVEPVRKPSSPQEGIGISVALRYGISIYVTIPGSGTLNGTVTGITYESKAVEPVGSQVTKNEGQKRSLTFFIDFENRGTLMVKPKGYVEIYDRRGKSISRMKIYPEDIVVLPGETFRFSAPYQGPDLYAGEYTGLGVIEYGGRNAVGAQFRLTIHEGGE